MSINKPSQKPITKEEIESKMNEIFELSKNMSKKRN